ncbi:MAG: ribonuclease P protein component [Pseudomonadota bacterium]|nr:ribonuclease P protein component [Pseudomonadota bacterium]
MPSTRFPRSARVRARHDFDRIFQQGRRVALPVMAVHWQPPAEPEHAGSCAATDSGRREPRVRIGLAVSRKVDPHAVGRNRIKRVLRDCFRHHRGELREGDYVVVARVGAARCTGEELRHAFLGLLRRAGALPAPAVNVTMPPAVPDSSPPPSAPEPASAPRVG